MQTNRTPDKGNSRRFSFRNAVRDDFDAIARFPQNRWEAYFMYPRGKYPADPDELFEVAQKRWIPTVIETDGEVVAYGNIYDLTAGESAWLGNVIVNPGYRRSGAGTYLIQTMKKRAKEELRIKELKLVCHNINTGALFFYKNQGFHPFDIKSMTGLDHQDIAGIMMKVEL
jgi:N-acetylglutamate synthase-like GNAT family acetyltransferase